MQLLDVEIVWSCGQAKFACIMLANEAYPRLVRDLVAVQHTL